MAALVDRVDARLCLVLLDGTEELMEVALAEASAARGLLGGLPRLRVDTASDSLYDLEEERRAVCHRLGKDLQQETLVVAVGEDAQLLALAQLGVVKGVLADALAEGGVVLRSWPLHEIKPAAPRANLPHRANRREDIVSLERDVLHSGAVVLLEVGEDLRLAPRAVRWLVERQQHALVVGCEDHGVEPRVDGAHVVSSELSELVEATQVLHVVDHLEQLRHVADHVVETSDAQAARRGRRARRVPGQEGQRAIVKCVAGDETQYGIAVELYLGHRASRVGVGAWRGARRSATLQGLIVGQLRVHDAHADCKSTHAMLRKVSVHLGWIDARIGRRTWMPRLFLVSRSSCTRACRVRSRQHEDNAARADCV
mmetsp:Transcript_21487/g.46227  ORF Transcript_21487/g.46227 Transcript_21487/m.46227 type:complete len:370 (-) Transcript_21487:350-1459(-)